MDKEQVSSIIRAIKVLECFMDHDTEWTLKNLVQRLELPTTTVFRQLSTLVSQGYLSQDPVRKSYHVGPRLLLLASTILGQSDLRSIARPQLEHLSAEVKETINLSMLVGWEIFYLDKVETFRTVVCNTKIGTRVPAHASSGGKVILAHKSQEQIDAYCARLPEIEPLTPKTITSPDVLRDLLIRARIDGYAVDDGEVEPNLICIGAPIFGIDHNVVAAVSVAGPDFRMKQDLNIITQKVMDTANHISKLLGGHTGH